MRLLATRRLVDFALEDVDCAVRFGGGDYPGLVVVRLISESIIPVAAPSLAAGVAEVADLLEKPLLNDGGTRQPGFPDWETWFASPGRQSGIAAAQQAFRRCQSHHPGRLSGLGVALVWRSLVVDDLREGRLVLAARQGDGHAWPSISSLPQSGSIRPRYRRSASGCRRRQASPEPSLGT